MSFKNRSGIVLVILGIISIPLVRFGGGELLLISAFLVAFGAVKIVKEIGVGDRVREFLSSQRRSSPEADSRPQGPRIDPLLPVRVLKLAESHEGCLTVSVVAMALNVGLDECQSALDELVRKGAANVDVDLSTGVASYRFPEFLPHTIEGSGAL
jgi:hypothetical protein